MKAKTAYLLASILSLICLFTIPRLILASAGIVPIGMTILLIPFIWLVSFFALREIEEQDALSCMWKGHNFYDSFELKLAINHYDKGLTLCNAKTHSKLAAELYCSRGKAYYYLEQYDQAISNFSDAIALKKNVPDSYTLRGAAYMVKGEIEKAIEDSQSAIELEPDNPSPYGVYGQAHRALYDYEKAIDFYSQAIMLDHSYERAYMERGITYACIGQYEKAIENYIQALKLSPTAADIHFAYGEACENLNDHESALRHYETAINIQPDLVDAYINKGYILVSQNHYPQAIKSFRKIITLQPKAVQAYAGCVRAYQALGDEEKSNQAHHKLDRCYEQITQCEDKNGDEYLALGLAYLSIGQHSISIKLFSRALQLKPLYTWINGYIYRSIAFLFQGDVENARQDMEQLIALHRSLISAGTYVDLARLQGISGLNGEAMTSLNKAIEINADLINAYYMRGNLFNNTSDRFRRL
jgi:tetratricopeptide (TPR) repeat protein